MLLIEITCFISTSLRGLLSKECFDSRSSNLTEPYHPIRLGIFTLSDFSYSYVENIYLKGGPLLKGSAPDILNYVLFAIFFASNLIYSSDSSSDSSLLHQFHGSVIVEW
jgi:hypothetical protein